MHNHISLEASFNTLASHYKDTYDIHLNTLKERNRLFFFLLVIVSVFIIQFQNSSLVHEVFNGIIVQKIGSPINLSGFIPVLLWLVLMGTSLRYFQINIQIERQYGYLHALEEELNKEYDNSVAFTREGKSYLSNYPIFSNWICLLYTLIFPIGLLISILYRIPIDIKSWPPTLMDICCFVAYEIIGTTTILYLIKMHWKDENWLTKKFRGRKKPRP